MRRGPVLVVVALAACSGSDSRGEVELLITPTAFFVDGLPYPTPASAAEAVKAKSPVTLAVVSCAAMETKRVLDAMASLKGKHAARLAMSVAHPGERGCPEVLPTQQSQASQ